MSSSHVGNQYLDEEIAVREVSRVFDLMKKLQALLQFKTINGDEAIQMHDLSQSLLGESFQALNNALCIMQPKKIKTDIKLEILPTNSNHGSTVSYEQRIEKGKNKRRRKEDYSWTNITTMPYDDGYQWRKYGEKKISGSDFPRGYFRCTYKDGQNCPATKLVQQRNNNDSPLFDVKYTHKHTCSNSLKQITTPSYPQVDPFNAIEQIKSKENSNHMMAQSLNEDSGLNDKLSEWDIDSFIMELAGYEEDYFPLWSEEYF